MKPNTQLNNIISLAMGRNIKIDLCCYTQQITVHQPGETMGSYIADRLGMEAIADHLALTSEDSVLDVMYVNTIARAKAVGAIKREADKPRWKRGGTMDITGTGTLVDTGDETCGLEG